MAGNGEEQVQLLRRSAARLPLPRTDGERIAKCAGGVLQLQTEAGRALSGHLEQSDHEQAPARSRRRARRWQLADLPPAGGHTRRRVDRGAVHWHAIQLGDTHRRSALQHATARAALQPALLRLVCQRRPQHQGWLPARRKLLGARAREWHPQPGIRVQQPGAGQRDAMGHSVPAQGAEQGLRILRAGSVDAATADAHLRCSVRVLQRLRSAAARGCDAKWVGARAQLRRSEKRSAVERCRSAHWRRVRRLRQWPYGCEGRDRPVRREDGYRNHAAKQPDPDLDQFSQPHLE